MLIDGMAVMYESVSVEDDYDEVGDWGLEEGHPVHHQAETETLKSKSKQLKC